ncbi:MAG: hypothetical protein ACLTLQ_03445 [[Clostridium] scindens]
MAKQPYCHLHAGGSQRKAGDFRCSTACLPTEMRRTIALLKKYQIIGALDVLRN